MLHFLNPGGLRQGEHRGESKTSTAILLWFTVTANHTAPHYLYHVGRGRREEQRRGEESRVGEDRYHILLRARSAEPDQSLSCLPLEASWTKHRAVDSLRTLLLQKDESSHFPKKTRPLLYFSFSTVIIYPPFFSGTLLNSSKTLALHAVTALYLALFQVDALRNKWS